MHGKMQARSLSRRAFTLIEIMIVVVIMAIVIGVVGSLLAGYIRMFNETDDQAAARQRAQDVFNALEVPIVNCGLGIPTDSTNGMTYYNTAPIASWGHPLEMKNTSDDVVYASSLLSGDVLRIVYSIPSGVKNENKRVSNFTTSGSGASETLTLTGNLPADLTLVAGDASDTRNYVTFPMAYMSPLGVSSSTSDTITVTGKTQPAANATTHPGLAQLIRGEIPPYMDLHFVRAIAAYVDDQSVFHASEVNATDVTQNNPKGGGSVFQNAPGLRVEGIKAVWFETDADRKLLTVRVLAEGDVIDETRIDNTDTRAALRSRWGNVTNWDRRIFYADFEMVWRIRNYTPN